MWMQATANVSEVARDSFNNVLDYSIFQYLSLLTLHIHKIKLQNEQISKHN